MAVPAGATDPKKDAALVVDGRTGKVLFSRNETALRHPASLTKMMTLYLLFEALRAKRMTMQTEMPVSRHAAAQKPTKLNLRPGQTINVDTAIRAIVIRSANDVAVVIAEALGGTELHFAELMNQKARQLGMKDTNYHNASGLPDPLQITTANDLAVLARHLAYDFPQYFSYFSLSGFKYKGTYYPTHDNLIGRYDGADGIKTGFTGASGFNLASSVTRDGVNLIGIVMGGYSAVRRDVEMMHLLDSQFAAIEANPTMVAHGPVPWLAGQTVAVAEVIPPAQLRLTPSIGNEQVAALTGLPPPPPATDDEETAETRRAPDENFALVPPPPKPPVLPAPAQVAQAQAPAHQPAVPPLPPKPVPAVHMAVMPHPLKPKAAPPQPALRSLPHPALVASAPPAAKFDDKLAVLFQPPPKSAAKLVLKPKAQAAKPQPAKPAVVADTKPSAPAKPQQKPVVVASATPALRPDTGEGDSDMSGGRTWTIQIGAFADPALAKAQLASYAAKAKDVVGEAARIVAPITGANGHVLYRARFGLYEERQARQVCGKLTQLGQTCFAVARR